MFPQGQIEIPPTFPSGKLWSFGDDELDLILGKMSLKKKVLPSLLNNQVHLDKFPPDSLLLHYELHGRCGATCNMSL